jgi:hypothetical protein
VSFQSILFEDGSKSDDAGQAEEPAFFRDLNLDQVVRAVTTGFEDYDLGRFYHVGLRDPDAIRYRQRVMADLEREDVGAAVRGFTRLMRDVRGRLKSAEDAHYPRFGDRWFLEAAGLYCDGVERLASELVAAGPTSPGWRALTEYLATHVRSAAFGSLAREARRLLSELSAIRYCVLIDGGNVQVRPYENEADYASAVEATFERFRRRPVEDYLSSFSDSVGVNHVTAQILDGVAELHPDVFRDLGAFRVAWTSFVDPVLVRFDREVQFYRAYLHHMERLRRAGLEFCYPGVSRTSKEVWSRGSFDLALASKLLGERGPTVVPNDFSLVGPERVLVVSGPNQGGKTTFARTFGQLHYLASLGCPVPGTGAKLFLCDRLSTHFERQERVTDLTGKLHDDLIRMRRILDHATPDSLVIINEMFTSTALDDALLLSTRIMERLSALGLLTVWVTFLTELATFDERTTSMVAGVDPSDPAIRTFRLEKRPADGLAYAAAIARKYGVTYEQIQARVSA